mmetsp:Transcript_34138/g.82675  ORF Transcript_34138/g.82675 Transcript_34138/m.82675 type:complete len:549 (-) Transcript_34138:354-2000(-)
MTRPTDHVTWPVGHVMAATSAMTWREPRRCRTSERTNGADGRTVATRSSGARNGAWPWQFPPRGLWPLVPPPPATSCTAPVFSCPGQNMVRARERSPMATSTPPWLRPWPCPRLPAAPHLPAAALLAISLALATTSISPYPPLRALRPANTRDGSSRLRPGPAALTAGVPRTPASSPVPSLSSNPLSRSRPCRAEASPQEQLFDRVVNTIYTLDSSRDEFLSRVKNLVRGKSPIDDIRADDYFVKPDDWVVITGATEGIGAKTAEFLVRQGTRITIIGRDQKKGDDMVSKLQGLAPTSESIVTFVRADLVSLQSVQSAIDKIYNIHEETGKDIRCLINNAGIWPTKLKITEDGIESAFQVNHLSHYLLTRRLLPLFDKPARVVTTSSLAHALFSASPKSNFEDVNWESRTFENNPNYGRSKLCNLLFARQLALELETVAPHIKSVAIHPGVVATQLFREFIPNGSSQSEYARGLQELAYTLLKSPEEGSQSLTYAVIAPKVLSGSYYVDCEPRPMSAAGRDTESAQKLWDFSESLINEKLGPVLPPTP